jgi:hypothetical protein
MVIKTTEIYVTPEMAREYLLKSEGNRRLNQPRIDGYIRDLISKKWFVGDTIKFNEEGMLIDGHHRLRAVSQSGIPAPFLVTTGLPKNSVNGINLAIPWRPDQISKVDGNQFSRLHFTMARILEYGPTPTARFILTYSEHLSLVLKYEQALNFSAKLNSGHHRFLNSIILAVIARAFYSVQSERLTTFAEVMQTGEVVSVNNDSAAIRLRNFMISGKDLGHSIDRLELYKRAENALWHFCKCHYVKSLKPAHQEMFPLKLNERGEVVPA